MKKIKYCEPEVLKNKKKISELFKLVNPFKILVGRANIFSGSGQAGGGGIN